MKLALITPWPYQQTGIADYAYDLTAGLAAKNVAVDIFTNCRSTTGISGSTASTSSSTTGSYSQAGGCGRIDAPAGARIFDLDRFAGPGDYDNVVYEFGNCSDFHIDQIPVIAQYPGIVHLHDLCLHHLVAFSLYRGDTQMYYDVLAFWYGKAMAARVREHNQTQPLCFWDSNYVNEVPFFDPVLQFATGCIVHSQFACDAIQRRWPMMNVEVVRQLYQGMNVRDETPPGDVLQIGVFGVVQPHKHVDKILNSVAACNAGGKRVHVHVCGSVEKNCEGLYEQARQMGIADAVTFHGRLSDEQFKRFLAQTDLCISLRAPTMGETSAVVSRTLQLGIPTVVNDVGWYAELPENVRKLPVEPVAMQQSLTDLLTDVLTDRRMFADWVADCRTYAIEHTSFESAVNRFIQAVGTLTPSYRTSQAPSDLQPRLKKLAAG